MKEDATPIRVGPDIYYIDPLELGAHSVSGVYLIVANGITLIEAGTSHLAPHIFQAVRSLGFEEKDIVRCVVTHVHLDHAGAAGWLVERLPDMQVCAHARGVRHLADPSRLMQSAQMVYGDMKTLLEIHGDILPVPERNLIAVTDSEIDVGNGIRLKIFEAPGHAPHHICIFEPVTGCLFAGEALGHYHPEFDIITPAVAPPGFDLEASRATSAKILELEPSIICFSQFGQHRDAGFVIREFDRLTVEYGNLILESLRKEKDTSEIIGALYGQLLEEPQARKFSEQSIRGMLMSIVLGYYQYFQKTGALN